MPLTPAFPLALPLLLLIPAIFALLRRFDGLYGQDPFAYYDYATGPLRLALQQLAPPPPFYWPPGYPLLVALASFALGARPLAGQLVSLLAGALVPLCTALLAREVWPATPDRGRGGSMTRPRGVAPVPPSATRSGRVIDPPLPAYGPFVAGLLMAYCGQLWQSSIVVMSDTTGLAAATAGIWALVRYGHRRHGVWLALASALLAYAILTRWAYALVALPCLAYGCWLLSRTASGERRRTLQHFAIAAIIACAILSPVLWPLLTPQRANPQSFAVDLQVYRWHPLNALRRAFDTADGRLVYPWPNGFYYATLLARPLYFTPLLAWLLLPGLWVALRRPTAPLLLLVGWAGSVAAFHAGAPWQNVRFALALAPPCAILIALGLAAVWRGERRWHQLAASALLTLGLAWMLVANLQLLDGFIARKEADLAVARALTAPPDTRLLTFGLTLTVRHYTPYPTFDLSELDPATLATLLADGRPTLLLLDVPNIEQQWPGRAPETNYRWLRTHPGLTLVAEYGPYTLFQIGLVGSAGQVLPSAEPNPQSAIGYPPAGHPPGTHREPTGNPPQWVVGGGWWVVNPQ